MFSSFIYFSDRRPIGLGPARQCPVRCFRLRLTGCNVDMVACITEKIIVVRGSRNNRFSSSVQQQCTLQLQFLVTLLVEAAIPSLAVVCTTSLLSLPEHAERYFMNLLWPFPSRSNTGYQTVYVVFPLPKTLKHNIFIVSTAIDYLLEQLIQIKCASNGKQLI